MKFKLFLLSMTLCAAGLAADKPFELKLRPGVTEYTVTPTASGTFWIVSDSKALVPVGRQHFADLRWDDGLPFRRRLLQGNQTEKRMPLDRVVFKQGVPRKLRFTVDPKEVVVSRIIFRPEVPTRFRPPAAAKYKPPFDPPAKHPRVLVNPAFLKQLKQNLTAAENRPAWESLRQTAVKPFNFRIDPDQEMQFQGPLVLALRQKAFYCMVTGDRKVGREAIDLARKYMNNVAFGNGQDICRKVGESIYSTALVYDWCYDLMTPQDKQDLLGRMLYFCPEMETGWPPFNQSAASGHGNEAQISRDLLAMAIAIWNENPEPWRWIAYQMIENLKPYKAFSYLSERHSQGTMYGRGRHSWDLFGALQFKRTFGHDLLIPQAGKVAYEWYYLRLPDGRFLAEGDVHWNWRPGYVQLGERVLLPNMALYRDPELKQELFRGGFDPARFSDPAWFLLTNDPNLKAEDRRDDLPLTRIYPSPLPGMYIRTGWNFSTSADDALIALQGAACHFGNHQHMDMGSIQIYYRGNIVTDLGQYRLYGVPYDTNLAKTSALHSLMRFQDPEQKKWGRNPKIVVNCGGEDFSAQTNRPADIPEKLQTACMKVGTTPFAGCGPDKKRPVYSFMELDLSCLFQGRVKYYTRSFVFLNQSQAKRPGTLFVLDRYETTAPRIRPIFQLTTIPKPVWQDGVLTAETRQYGKSGKVTLTPLIPANVEAKILTAKDAHTFAGKFIPARDPKAPEARGSRTELTGPGNIFLTALQIHDGHTPVLPVRAEPAGDRYFAALGAEADAGFGGWLVGFGDPRKPTAEAFSFEVANDKTRVLLTDLAPGNWRIKGGQTDLTLASVKGSGEVFAVLDKGEYKAAPNSSANVSPASDLHAVPTPPPAKNQVWLDGKLLSVRTVVKNGHLLIPATVFAKPSGNVLRIPGTNAATLRVGDRSVTIRGYEIKLPVPLDKDFAMPVDTAGGLFGMTAEVEPDTGTVMLNTRKEPSDILFVTATDQPGALRDLLVKQRGEWVAHGRKTVADIVFSDVKQLSGIEFHWPQGTRRKQFLQVDVSPDGKKFDTVFDGASDGKSYDQTVKFSRRAVRVIRLYMKGNSSNTWNTTGAIRFLP